MPACRRSPLNSPARTSAKAGPNATIGTIRRSTNGGQLFVAVRSSDTSDALVPPLVSLAAGALQTSFPVAAVDNLIVDGPRTNSILAFVADSYSGQQVGSTVSQTLIVTDDDGPTLTLGIAKKVVPEGATPATTGTVRRNTSTNASLVVTLDSSNTNKATVPATVTIPVGQNSATFEINTIDNGITDGNTPVTITASAKDFTSGSDNFDRDRH